jgi:hypothetical protein
MEGEATHLSIFHLVGFGFGFFAVLGIEPIVL